MTNRSTLHVSFQANYGQGSSPTPDGRHRLQVPDGQKWEDSKYTWGEDEIELIHTCAVLSSSLGLCKSLSTSDIFVNEEKTLRAWVSDDNVHIAKDGIAEIFPQKIEPISRSCSTWVAVGDVVSTSQLPSPQTRLGAAPAITAVDLIRSVNKKVRQNYIKRRLHMSYRILKRMPPPMSNEAQQQQAVPATVTSTSTKETTTGACGGTQQSGNSEPQQIFEMIKKQVDLPSISVEKDSPKQSSLTPRDVQRDQGRPLTRYERNIIIFNWLQNLDEVPFESLP